MLGNDPMVMEFRKRWESLGGRVRLADGQEALLEACQDACREALPDPGVEKSRHTVVYWNDPDTPHLDWRSIMGNREDINWVAWEPTEQIREATAGAILGITGCAWAASSTGSVALYSSPSTGLLPSVLAPAHMVLIARDRLVASVADGLARIRAGALPPLVKIITGPSMTADIEGILVTGVHGPGQILAVIYDL